MRRACSRKYLLVAISKAVMPSLAAASSLRATARRLTLLRCFPPRPPMVMVSPCSSSAGSSTSISSAGASSPYCRFAMLLETATGSSSALTKMSEKVVL